MNLEARMQNNDSPISEWDINASLALQLEQAKQELELVSYVASHDLLAPLRVMTDTCKALEGNRGIAEDKQARAGLRKIGMETDRMKILMQGLLDYLRLETYGPSHAWLNMNEVVQAALTILGEEIKATGARIACDSLPSFYGHRGRMTRLFVGLLDNALKFHGSEPPEIHISASMREEELEFCVEDNGIGIEDEYHNIIFALFQRLHTEEEYPGYGIGLALCRKIVESHHGRIWVESSPDEGARFRFTLPVKDN